MNFLKGRAILWLLIPIAFLIAFLWDSSEPNKPSFIQEPSNPDYFLVDTKSIEFSAEGVAERQFSSSKTLHYVFRQHTQMENPALTFTNQQAQNWTLKAESALSNELTEELFLTGGVTILMQPLDKETSQVEAIELTTDKLTIDFGTEMAHTDSSILLRNAFYQLTATGMSVDLNQNSIHFKSQVVSEEL